jgi:hypothetical protein
VQTYSSTRSLCSIGRSNTLTDQYLEDGNFAREGTRFPEQQQPSLAPVKSSALRFRPGEDKCHQGPIISEQSPVLTQYRKLNTENIGISPPSCGEPHGEAIRLPGPSGILAEVPGESRYGRTGVKKSGCLRRGSWEILCAWREFLVIHECTAAA